MNTKLGQIQLLLEKNKLTKALALLKKYNTKPLATYRTLDWEAYCYAQEAKWPQAINCWTRAIDLAPSISEKTETLFKISEAQFNLGVLKASQNTLITSLSIDSGVANVTARLRLCEVSLALNDFGTVELYGNKLLSFDSTFLLALTILAKSAYIKGDKLLVLKRLDEFSKYVEQLSSEQICYVTDMYIRLNEINKAEKFLDKFSVTHGSELWLLVYEGVILLEKKYYDEAISKLVSIDVSKLPEWLEKSGIVYVTLAKAYDKTKCFPQAFDFYNKSSVCQQRKLKNIKSYDALKFYKSIDIGNIPEVQSDYAPVFMLGFPRSGTTLLETIIDTADHITTLSEPETITYLVNSIVTMTKAEGYVQALPKLKEKQLQELQELYITRVQSYVPNFKKSQILVDKMPLYSIYLPLINALFPNSKYIVNIRHPLDVVLSNFQQNFQINSEMAFLVDLEGCVNRYVSVMSFLEQMKESLSMDFIDIRYEDLILDINNETNRLFDFIGVEHRGKIEDFYLHANDKVINTASKAQVTKPLYNESVYKWKNYRQQLSPYFDKLRPFIEKYGYQVS